MPEIMILFGTCLVCGVAGAIFKLQDWADERKARHMFGKLPGPPIKNKNFARVNLP